MSKKVPEEQYQKTFSYKFRQWLDGTKDPYLGTVEMKSQENIREDEETVQQREEEKRQLVQKTYDLEHNAEIRIFQKIYRVFCVLFCVFLVTMLLVAVSHLPTFGRADNPVNNEVAAR